MYFLRTLFRSIVWSKNILHQNQNKCYFNKVYVYINVLFPFFHRFELFDVNYVLFSYNYHMTKMNSFSIWWNYNFLWLNWISLHCGSFPCWMSALGGEFVAYENANRNVDCVSTVKNEFANTIEIFKATASRGPSMVNTENFNCI